MLLFVTQRLPDKAARGRLVRGIDRQAPDGLHPMLVTCDNAKEMPAFS